MNQLDAMRLELHKERALRQRAHQDHVEERSLLFERIETLETLSIALQDRLSRTSSSLTLLSLDAQQAQSQSISQQIDSDQTPQQQGRQFADSNNTMVKA
jgi:hypothetical protein